MPSRPAIQSTSIGPLGFPMTDDAAFTLEKILKSLPSTRREPRRCIIARSTPLPLERADVSWITEESVDRSGDIVLAAGMDDSVFQKNPVVTYNHRYDLPPVGLSAWRRQAREANLRGIRAKTLYPARPNELPPCEQWLPDPIFSLVQAGLLAGKSIGFLPLRFREAQKENARLIIEQWLLLEYACCAFPAQPNALVEQVTGAQSSDELSPSPV